jgi:hypothetical protein
MGKGFFSFLEGIIAWCVGFLLAGLLCALLIFYAVPVVGKIPVDTGKYVQRAETRIAENQKQRGGYKDIEHDAEVEKKSFSDMFFQAIDQSTDNIIKWINGSGDKSNNSDS